MGPDFAGQSTLVSKSHDLLSSMEKQGYVILIYNPEPHDHSVTFFEKNSDKRYPSMTPFMTMRRDGLKIDL